MPKYYFDNTIQDMFTWFDQIFEKQHEELKNIGSKQVNIISETLQQSEDTKALKEPINKFSSKTIEHEKHLPKIITSF